MKQEEVKYLELEKTNNGKSLEQARLEIKKLIQSQKDFKNLNKEILILENRLKTKDKLIEKLRNLL